jgi:DNA-binding CsgD family transcriptional regulator
MSRSSDRSPRARKGDPLTDREIQILSLVAAGELTSEVGRRLGIAENTVKSHLTHVYKKIGARNRVQATRYYVDRYTATPASSSPGQRGDPSLIERQIGEIKARLDQLSPAATEVERLQHALSALRALDHR